MTIFDLLFCVGISLLLGFTFCYLQFVMPLKASRSRLIGKLNQKEWQVTEWQLAYNKANNDFMKLAEVHKSESHSEATPVKDEGWIKWEYSEATPYPLTLDAIVDVKFGDGEIFEQESVNYWQCSGTFVEGDCWTKRENIADTIIAYRVVN